MVNSLRFGHLFLAVLLVGALLCTSCVRSRVLVTSEPEGAVITMNGINIGPTPVKHPFTWYWYYDFTARKDGYVPDYQRQRFRAPVYLWIPFDLLMEMMPFWVVDEKKVHFVLEEDSARPDPILVSSPSSESDS